MGDVHAGGKLGGDGVLIDIGGLHLVQNDIQSLTVLGGADKLAVDGEHIVLHHVADLIEEIGLKLSGGGNVLLLNQGEGVGNITVQSVVISQDLRGPGLYPIHRILKDLRRGDGAQSHAVHLHHIGGGVNGGDHSGHAHNGGHSQEVERADNAAAAGSGGVGPVLEPLGANADGAAGSLNLGPQPGGQTLSLPFLWNMKDLVHGGIPLLYRGISMSLYPVCIRSVTAGNEKVTNGYSRNHTRI